MEVKDQARAIAQVLADRSVAGCAKFPEKRTLVEPVVATSWDDVLFSLFCVRWESQFLITLTTSVLICSRTE